MRLAAVLLELVQIVAFTQPALHINPLCLLGRFAHP